MFSLSHDSSSVQGCSHPSAYEAHVCRQQTPVSSLFYARERAIKEEETKSSPRMAEGMRGVGTNRNTCTERAESRGYPEVVQSGPAILM